MVHAAQWHPLGLRRRRTLPVAGITARLGLAERGAAVAERLVLHPTAALVELGARQIQHAEADRGAPVLSALVEPGARAGGAATTSRSWVWLGLTSTIEVHL
jgi:hypothetical protein